MAVAHDGEANTTGTSAGSDTITITGKPTAGTNRLGMVSVAWFDQSRTVVSATWDGVAMTLVDEGYEGSSIGLGCALFRIVAPPTGATNIVVTLSGTVTQFRGVAHSYTGVDQTTPCGTPAKVINSVAAALITNTATTAADEMVVDAVSFFQGNSDVVSPGANQTAHINVEHTTHYYILGSRQAGGDGGVMSWTFTSGGGYYASIAVSVKAAVAVVGNDAKITFRKA